MAGPEDDVRTQVTSPERVLVKEVNWLGDVVMSLPALRAVRGAFPRSHLSVMIKRELASFFDGSRWIDELITYSLRSGVQGLRDRKRMVEEIRKRNFSICVLFPNSFDSALWPTLARVPVRAGFARDGRGFLLTNRVKPGPAILEVHQVYYYLDMLRRTLGVAGDPTAYEPDVAAPARERMETFLEEKRRHKEAPLLALAVSAAYGPAKEWPTEHFAALIDMLADKHGAECVLVGAPSERKKAEEIAGRAKAETMVAAGETSVGEVVALLSLCAGFAGNDSGAMHVAGALNLPTVGIFGSTSPERTAPLGQKTKILQKPLPCAPCLERTCKLNTYECLHALQPKEVVAALEELGTFNDKNSTGNNTADKK